MPDSGLLVLSGVCLATGVSFILFPDPLKRLSGVLDRTLVILDQSLMRHRYLIAVALFVTSYLFFRLALLLPELGG